MKITLSFVVDDIEEIHHIIRQVPDKAFRITQRSPQCICKALEADDFLKNTNGKTVGRITVKRSS